MGIGQRSRDVARYHYDEALPGKPLRWLIPGGLVALTALAFMGLIAWRTWHEKSLRVGDGIAYLVMISPAYIAGVFLFSYGYTLYDLGKSVTMTLLIVVVSVFAVVILAAVASSLKASGRERHRGDARRRLSFGGNRRWRRRPPAPGSGEIGCRRCDVVVEDRTATRYCPECGARL